MQLKVEETGEVFSDKLKFFTLELPSYRNMSESDCKTKIDYWLYNITNLETMTSSVSIASPAIWCCISAESATLQIQK